MSRVIAFFDFDGTITRKDSLLEFIRFTHGPARFCLGFLLCAPLVAAYKLKLISNQRAKEAVLRFFFGRMREESFNQHCIVFSRQKLPSLIRPKALAEIGKLQSAGAKVVVVSASPVNWLNGWCAEKGLQCIATRLEVVEGRLTGKIEGLNCHGEEKVRRIYEKYDLPAFSPVYCYGDTPGDKPMLSLGDLRFYRPFR